MRILIVGASGLVGGTLYHSFLQNPQHTIVGTYHHFQVPKLIPLDITSGGEVKRIINEFKPEVVLHPAAFADVDGCERNPDLCHQINSVGVRNVIDACSKTNSLFVFFSSDYVFDGKAGPYREEDQTNPQNVYGRVKLEVENYLQKTHPNHLIIRTCGVFGHEVQGKNFVIRLLENLKKGQVVNIVSDQQGSPTYVNNLTKGVSYLVENGFKGLFHVSGKTVLMRFEFAKLIAVVFNLDQSLIKPIKTAQIQQEALRPMRGGLLVDKVQQILPFPLLTAREGLEEMKKEK